MIINNLAALLRCFIAYLFSNFGLNIDRIPNLNAVNSYTTFAKYLRLDIVYFGWLAELIGQI